MGPDEHRYAVRDIRNLLRLVHAQIRQTLHLMGIVDNIPQRPDAAIVLTCLLRHLHGTADAKAEACCLCHCDHQILSFSA